MRKTIALLVLLFFSFQITSFAEENEIQQPPVQTGLKITPGKFIINEEVPQGSKEYILNLKVFNNSSQAQAVTVVQEGYLKSEKEVYFAPMGKEIEIPLYFDIPKDAEIGKRNDGILLKISTPDKKHIMQYRILSTFDIIEGNNVKNDEKDTIIDNKEETDNQNQLYLIIGIVIVATFIILLIVFFVIKRKKKRNNLFELYK